MVKRKVVVLDNKWQQLTTALNRKEYVILGHGEGVVVFFNIRDVTPYFRTEVQRLVWKNEKT